MKVKTKLNNKPVVFDIEPGEYLLDTLRKHPVTSVKRGCDAASCGVCTVLINNEPMLSCSLLTARTEGKEITTVEGIQDAIRTFYDYFGDEGADQCGFCNPALALTVYAMKHELTNPTLEEVREYLVGNLCRCSGYEAQYRAIYKYLGDQS